MRTVKRQSPDSTNPAYLEALLVFAQSLGLDRVGITDASILHRARSLMTQRKSEGLSDTMGFTYRNPQRSTDPGIAVVGAKSILVAARSYNTEQNMPEDDDNMIGARVARYAQADHYTPLRQALQKVAWRLRADGFRAVVFADENDVVDREVAYRAGLGWFGKNANLLLPGAGSWFVLGSVVTTAQLTPNTHLAPDGCGTCQNCIVDCPTGAIVGPGIIDARKCLAWLLQKPGIFPLEYRVALGNRLYGCDDCQESCPPTIRLGHRHRARPEAAPGPGALVDVLSVLRATDDELIERFGRWYLSERNPKWLRRNALIILGNVGPTRADSTLNRDVEQVLRQYLIDSDPILRAHALWSCARLGRNDLVAILAEDRNEIVRAEFLNLADIVSRAIQ